MPQALDYLDQLAQSATPSQRARARALTPGFAAASGLQSWSVPELDAAADGGAYRLALANIVESDSHPTPRAASMPGTGAFAPTVTLHVQADGTCHPLDAAACMEKVGAWPREVTRVNVVVPRAGVAGVDFDRGFMPYLLNIKWLLA